MLDIIPLQQSSNTIISAMKFIPLQKLTFMVFLKN